MAMTIIMPQVLFMRGVNYCCGVEGVEVGRPEMEDRPGRSLGAWLTDFPPVCLFNFRAAQASQPLGAHTRVTSPPFFSLFSLFSLSLIL